MKINVFIKYLPYSDVSPFKAKSADPITTGVPYPSNPKSVKSSLTSISTNSKTFNTILK